MSSQKSSLQKQLEQEKFLHGIAYVQNASIGIKKLTTAELAYLNQLLTQQNEEPWRLNPTEVVIPSGQRLQFNLISNPVAQARDILGNAFVTAGNDQVIEAAVDLYSQLVLNHLFKDANRRTAVLATIWLLNSNGIQVDPQKLHDIPLGNLRDKANVHSLAAKIEACKI